MRTLSLVAVLVLTACPDRIKKIDPVPDAGCGDGLINAMLGEECEGSDLNGVSCQSLGFDTGALSCSECKLVKTLCVKRCGNGVIDTGEACDGDAGVPGCSDFGYVSCTATCGVDHTHCVTSPFMAANGALQQVNGGPAVVADTPPHGLGDLVMVVESRARVEVLPYTVQQGFLTNGLKLSFGDDPVQAIAQGDDIIARNRNGSLDRYHYSGTSYARSPFPDGGCSGNIVGEVGSGQIATQSCDAGALLIWASNVTRAPANGGACSIADFDHDGQPDVLSLNGAQLDVHLAPGFTAADAGLLPVMLGSLVAADFDQDGDLDLAGFTGTSLKLLENTGNGAFADRLTLPASSAPHDLRVADLDLDGRVDLAWEAGDHAEVRRNQGSWVFSPYQATFGTGPALSFSVGDVDGDGDLDLVSTRSAGGDQSVSYVQLNRVR